MATYNKFNIFVEDLLNKVHDLFGTNPGTDCDVCNIYLSNAAVVATNSVKTDVAEITQENGYTGPIAITNNGSRSAGTATFSGISQQITASGGTIGPFTHVILYNDTPTSPVDPLISYWSRAGALTLNDGESFNVQFNNQAPTNRGDIFTLA